MRVCAYVLRASALWPAVLFALVWRGLWRAVVGACVGASHSVVVIHLRMWLCLSVGLALSRRRAYTGVIAERGGAVRARRG